MAEDHGSPARSGDPRGRNRDLRPGGVTAGPPSRLTPRARPASPPAAGPGTTITKPASVTPVRTADGPAPRWFRRRPALVAGGVLLVLFAGLVWVLVTGWLARGQLADVRTEVRDLQHAVAAGDIDSAGVSSRLADIADHAHRAHQLTTGPAWAVTAAVPWLGDPAQTTRGITATADDLGRTALPALGQIADRLATGTLRQGNHVDVQALTRLTPDIRTAADRIAAASRALDALPGSTWLPPVDRAGSDVTQQMTVLAGQLRSADTAVQVLPTLLGATTPQRFFVAFQNNAEARGTGGIPGAFAIVTAVDGTLTFERFESDDTLVKPLVDVDGQVDLGPDQADFLAQYGLDTPFGDYRESNESPNFPYAAQIWAAMWQKYSGEQITGAIALDPTALSYLLEATGPVKLADGTELDADTIVPTVQKDVYARFPGLDPASVDRRKQYLLDVASQTEKALLAPGADTPQLVSGASQAARERRLLVWSADPAVESVLAMSAIGGAIPDTPEPFGMLTVVNVAGTKLDYYLDRRLSWARSGCGDTRDVTVTITVTNRAPDSGLPDYVTYRADDPPADTPVGSNRLVLDYLATAGALLENVTVDGAKGNVQVYEERGHPVFSTIVELPPGGSHTVVLRLHEPAGTAPVTLITQPLVQPMSQSATDDPGC